MDIAVECPECKSEMTVSSVCDFIDCKCGANVDVKANRKSRLKLKNNPEPEPPASESAPAEPDSNEPAAAAPSSSASDIMARAQNKEPESGEVSTDDLAGRHKS